MGSWQNDGSLTKYTTAPNTRSLTVTSNLQAIRNATDVTDPTNHYAETVTTTMAVLFYESPNASVAVLSRIAKGCYRGSCNFSEKPLYTGDIRKVSWIDNSPSLRGSCGSRPVSFPVSQYYTPFASSQYVGGTNFSVVTFFRGKTSSDPSLITTIYSRLKNSEYADTQMEGRYR